MAKFFIVGKKMRIRTILISMMLIVTLTNCASYDFSRRVVQQGNLLQQPVVDGLKIGMTKDETASHLGHSLLSPTFNDDRWDYAYTWRRGSGPLEVRNLSLYFKHGSLVRIERKP
jgi:outer membrane protein assembly factor BamE